MSVHVKEAANIPEWKITLAKKYFHQEDKKTNSVSSTEDPGIEEEFEQIFSKSFIENYNGEDAFSTETKDSLSYDPDVLKTPRSLKELASKASIMNISNDSGYEGVGSSLKKRKNREEASANEVSFVQTLGLL